MAELSALRRNLTGMLQEVLAKLGYADTPVTLYYPADSLARVLGVPAEEAALTEALTAFAAYAEADFGSVTFRGRNGRWGVTVSGKGLRYVRDNEPPSAFLKEFLAAVSRHGVTVDEVAAVFARYGRPVLTPIESPEFDVLLTFENGTPDAWCYCLKQEGHHLTYHRFSAADYAALGIS